jgi:branched-chain amino acid transport system ATP-binding protein
MRDLLVITDVHARYGLGDVLRGMNVHVGEGEVVALFGRNGVGKSTLLKTIAGWVPVAQGSITLEGHTLNGLEPHVICHRGVGFVPEDRRIFPGLTVEENLALGFMQTPGVTRAESRRRLASVYDRFPRLHERRGQAGITLSGGEQQMLAIARILVGAPRLVLIDEPTEGLAPRIVDDIIAIIEQMRSEGLSVLLVEQNVHRALDIVDRFYAVERGEVALEGSPTSAQDREKLFEAIIS